MKRLATEREKGFEPSTSTLARWCASSDLPTIPMDRQRQGGRPWPKAALDRTSRGGKMGGKLRPPTLVFWRREPTSWGAS